MKKNNRDLANSQLVNAVQLDSYNYRIFLLLAENLFHMNGQIKKAKSCAERALLLNPSSEKTAKLLDLIGLKIVRLFVYFTLIFN